MRLGRRSPLGPRDIVIHPMDNGVKILALVADSEGDIVAQFLPLPRKLGRRKLRDCRRDVKEC